MTSENRTPETNQTDRKGGAPRENRNGLRHGLKSTRLPPGCSGIGYSLDRFRLCLENALIAQLGHRKISVSQAALIQSAVRFEKSALLAERYLRIKGKELTPTENLRFMKAATDATLNRDKCLERLQLESTPTSGQNGETMIEIPHIPTDAS